MATVVFQPLHPIRQKSISAFLSQKTMVRPFQKVNEKRLTEIVKFLSKKAEKSAGDKTTLRLVKKELSLR